MRAITLSEGRYSLQEVAQPVMKEGDILIRTAYTGVNRADLFQLQGHYPLPAGNPAIPGMELSGVVVACGDRVTEYSIGDNVCALVSEGAYAEYVSVPASHALPVPPCMEMDAAAALPEACFTAWISLVWQGHLQRGESVLIHGGGGGIGLIAIQLAKQLGARVFATAGTDEKCAACARAGAEPIHYKQQDFAEIIKQRMEGKGVDIILDTIGGDYFPRNLASLAKNGRLCIIAFLKGSQVNANISPILLKHLTVTGSTLRSRSAQQKTAIAAELRQNIWPGFATGKGIKPLIDKTFPLENAEKALGHMEQGLNVGKILLKI